MEDPLETACREAMKSLGASTVQDETVALRFRFSELVRSGFCLEPEKFEEDVKGDFPRGERLLGIKGLLSQTLGLRDDNDILHHCSFSVSNGGHNETSWEDHEAPKDVSSFLSI